MRFRSTFFDRRGYQSLPAGEVGGPGGEAGASSFSWYDEILGGGPDVNPELSGSLKFPVYDEMALTDPTIKSLIQFWSLSARSAVWGLQPRIEDDPVAIAIRDCVAWNVGLEGELGQMDLDWRGGLGLTIGMGLKHGPAIEELVWGDVTEWRDADGDAHLVRPLARLAPRPARTIGRVIRQMGKVKEITQTLPGTSPMPADKVSYIVFDPEETGRWEGSSMIRPAWAAWRMKKALQIAAGIGWDRFASGLPVIYHPDNEDAEARAKKIGSQIRQHERAFAHFPSNGPGVSGRPDSDWYLELVNGATTLADPVPLLRYFTEQESEAGLALFARLGQTQTGSRAVGEVQIDPFFLGVQAMATTLARERERQVIRRIVEVNFGLAAAELYTPKLTVTRIQARSIVTVAQAISYLSQAGFTFTDRGVQDDVREMLGFGLLPDAAEASGITVETLTGVLAEQGLTTDAIAAIVNALPAEIGIARNRVPGEGNGIVPATKALPPARANRELERGNPELAEMRRQLTEMARREPEPREPLSLEVNVRNEPGKAPIVEVFNQAPAQDPPTVVVDGQRPTEAIAERDGDKTVVRYRYDHPPADGS